MTENNSRVSLLGFRVENIGEYEENRLEISLMPLQRVYDDVPSDSAVKQLTKSVYESKIIALCGINSSGKTTLLKWIDLVLSVWLGLKPLKNYASLLDRFWCGSEIEADILVFSCGHFYRVVSKISKDKSGYFFTEEVIHRAPGSTGKSSIMDLSKYREVRRRSTIPANALIFLDRDRSIAQTLCPSKRPVNIWRVESHDLPSPEELKNMDSSVLGYLDPSLESLVPTEYVYMLKRRGKKAEDATYKELVEDLLSTGTLKGLALFSRIKQAFSKGGYVLVDDLEHSFSLSTCLQIMDFFMRENPNRSGAHLVFTTNNAAIVDGLPRADSVNLCARRESQELAVENLSTYLKRQDILKSELILADSFDLGTAISYDAYIAVKRWLDS